ncbi:MAG TPA: DUF1499 domain-containing protein [Stellaceae bacterium]|nr:DUF1499 domain-containing protein [Stellaceae bacterium]
MAENSAHIAAILFVVMAVAMAAAPLGYRLGFWSAATALTKVVAIGLLGGALAAVLAAVSLLSGGAQVGPGTTLMLVVIVVAGIFAVALPLRAKKIAERAPIKDITTDTENPPLFEAALPPRAKEGAVSEYPGAAVGKIQSANYPEIAPARMAGAPADAFKIALDAAKAMGWTILAADAGRGRIEASDRTLLFGFTDDVVVRLSPERGGSRVDMRSASRVGVSDLGKNAKRIRAYFATLAR